MLSVRVHQQYDTFELDAAFDSSGGLTALFGSSGSGKTSLLRLIAGLMRPSSGRVVIDDTVMLDTQSDRFLPPHRRGIGYVFQEPRLLPHLSVRQNLLYGRWFTRHRGEGTTLERIVELLDIEPLLDRPPGALSGGEAQRVAIGRALLARPRLLLMDEPFASIDELRKAEILPYVERLRDELKLPIIYVSHSLDEVVRLADTLVLIEHGHIVAAGPIMELLSRLDLPLLSRRLDAGVVMDAELIAHDDHWQLSTLRCRAGLLHVPHLDQPVGAKLRIWIRARDVALASDDIGTTSIVNVLRGRVTEVGDGDNPTIDVRLDCNGAPLQARITRMSAQSLALHPGREVHVLIKTVSFELTRHR